MTKMFITVDSDARKKQQRISVYRKAEIVLRYGSTKESIEALNIRVEFNEGDEVPTLHIDEDVKCIIKARLVDPTPDDMRGTTAW